MNNNLATTSFIYDNNRVTTGSIKGNIMGNINNTNINSNITNTNINNTNINNINIYPKKIIKDPYYLIPFILKKIASDNITYDFFDFDIGDICNDITLFENSIPLTNIAFYYFNIIGKTINSEINIKMNTVYDKKLDNVIDIIDNTLIEFDINNKPYINISNETLDTLEIFNTHIDNKYKNIILLNNININKENSILILSQPTLLVIINSNIKNLQVKYILNNCINTPVLNDIPINNIPLNNINNIKNNKSIFNTLFFKKILIIILIILIIWVIYSCKLV